MKSFFRRLKALLPAYRRAQDRDMQEELAALRQFAPPQELGNLTIAAEEARAALGFPLIESVGADIRHAWRCLKRDRGFTVVALLSLSIGVGANLAVFGLMDALLWRQLPVRHPEQLATFKNTSGSYFGYSEFARFSGEALQDVIAQSSVVQVPVTLGSEPVRRQVEFVSGGFFQALGVTFGIGRSILPVDDELQHPSQVAVLSNSYWGRSFNRDPGAVGRYLRIGKAQFQIIGIAPQDFFGLSVGENPDIWLPVTTYSAVFPATNWLTARNTNWLTIFGRLRSGVSISRAQAILSPISVDIDIQRNRLSPSGSERKAMLKDSILLIPASKGISELRDRFSQPLRVVFGMLCIGLLLACINIASLQIARADQSRKELAIRLAIGASRLRVVRQYLIEMLLLSVASTFVALLLFRPITTAVTSIMTLWDNLPVRLDAGLHSDLVVFVVSTCFAVAFLCGLLPALYATRRVLHLGLQSGSPSIAGSRNTLSAVRLIGIIQMAVSLVMITATCLFALNVEHLRRFDGGIRRDHLVEIEVDGSAAGYSEPGETLLDRNLRDRFLAIPGVQHVSYCQGGLYSGRNFSSGFEVEGKASSFEQNEEYGNYDYAGPNFFATLGTTILKGRDFTARDTPSGARVVIINQKLASRFFPVEDPIGRSLYFPDENGKKAYRIVGVVRDVRSNPRSNGIAWYFASEQHRVHPFSNQFLLRTKTPGKALLRLVSAAIRAENPKLQIENLQTANELFESTLQADRLLARLGWAFGVLAVLLASAGIYGMLSYDVTRRTTEIGIRAALGARRSDIAMLVLSRSACIVFVGLGVGAIAANAMTRLLQSLIFDLKASDPLLEIAAAVILMVVALLAAWIPVQRAAALDPVRTLRAES